MTTINFNRKNQDLIDSNGYRGNNNLNNIEFRFEFEDTKFLWKELMRLNAEHIERSGDLSTLEPYVENILYSRMMSDDIDYLSNDYITQLITLLQFIGQYLVYIQKRLESENENYINTINQLQNKIKDSERSEQLYEELKSQNKEKDFIIKTYQNMIKNGYDLNIENDKNNVENDITINLKSKKLVQTERKYYPCSICAGKKFKSQKYLDEHIKRRHYDLIESDFDQVKESNLENKNYKQVFEGRLNDMKSYFENVLKNIQENNGFNFLSRKIDNIQNQIIYQNNNNNRLNSNNNQNGICTVCGKLLHNMINNNNINIVNNQKKEEEKEKNKNNTERYRNINYRKNEKKEQSSTILNLNLTNENNQFERNKKRSTTSRVKESSKIMDNIYSQKEGNIIKNTYNINIDNNKKSLSESIKNEFKTNVTNNNSENSNLKNNALEEDKKHNDKKNDDLKKSKRYTNTPEGNSLSKIKSSNNSISNGQNKIIESNYNIRSNNNSNNPYSNPSLNKDVEDPKNVLESFKIKFMKRDKKYKGEIDDYKNIDFPNVYKKQDDEIKKKINERIGIAEKVKPKTVNSFIKEFQKEKDNNNINDIRYNKFKNYIFEALDLNKIIEDYNNYFPLKNTSKNSYISIQNNKNSLNLSSNKQSISGNKSTSKVYDNNSVDKEKDTFLNNDNKINNYDETTMSIIKNNLNQTNNPQTIHQNITIGYDLKNSVYN